LNETLKFVCIQKRRWLCTSFSRWQYGHYKTKSRVHATKCKL